MKDRAYWISIGKSRFDKKWKNKEVTWAELLRDRFSKPTRTQETQAEYLRMSKDEQDGIKDIGGFVGGVLQGGKRNAQTVKLRSMLTLDVDSAVPDLWDEIKLTVGYTCAVYSTHKHRPEAPRYRLIIPLDRDVSPDEYEAIARRVALDIGIDYFDDTTYQPSRLMYWPSYSRDGEYLFDHVEGEFLSADEVLKQYPDWTDVSSWPVSSRVEAVHKKTADKQGDPTTKPGMVGAFCRVYDVPAAIEKYLKDAYVDAGKGRYTYTGGSTSAGLVLYEDGAFAYSNHSTDPAGGRLCNAFDLVRLHLFGEKDTRALPDTPVNKLPSFAAMCALAAHDPEVTKRLTEEQMAEALQEFEDDGEEVSEADLERTDKGLIKTTIHNVTVLIRMNTAFDGVHTNLMADTIDITSELPWGKKSGIWTDSDDVQLRAYLEKFAQFPRQTVMDGLQKVADDRAVHPVREYLEKLPEWDGTERLDILLVDYLGAEDSEYTRQVTRKTLCAAVKRILVPGCKFDTILVLNGPQGIGKSTLIQKLGGEWFNDSLSLADTATKAGAEKLQGYWILEIGELAGMRKTDIETLRSFISRQDDVYRAAYARRVTHHKRQCIFIGTTNAGDAGYLRDLQGNRRFWDVRVAGEGLLEPWDITGEEVAQIWAEAKMRMDAGEELILRGDVLKEAEERQRQALESDPKEGQVQEYLDALLPEDWYDRTVTQRLEWLNSDFDARDEHPGVMQRDRVCNAEIWVECFHRSIGQLETKDSYMIGKIMKKIPGWGRSQKNKRIRGYGSGGVYEREKKCEKL